MPRQEQVALLKISNPSSFEWDNWEKRKEAEEHFEAGSLSVHVGDLNQAEQRVEKILRLSFEDHLEGHKMGVDFGEHGYGKSLLSPVYYERYRYRDIPTAYTLDTNAIFLPPKTFTFIDILRKYPYPQAFGEDGLDLGSIWISQDIGLDKLEIRFLETACVLSANSRFLEPQITLAPELWPAGSEETLERIVRVPTEWASSQLRDRAQKALIVRQLALEINLPRQVRLQENYLRALAFLYNISSELGVTVRSLDSSSAELVAFSEMRKLYDAMEEISHPLKIGQWSVIQRRGFVLSFELAGQPYSFYRNTFEGVNLEQDTRRVALNITKNELGEEVCKKAQLMRAIGR